MWSPLPIGNALTQAGTSLVRFSLDTPGTTTTQALVVGAIAAGETLVGIDGRPQTGQLYGLGVNATANTATLYLIDPQTGAVTAVGTPSQIAFVDAAGIPIDFPDPATAGYGIDFNPTVDRLRVVTSTGLNFRVNPNNGAPVDGNLNDTVTPPAGVNPDAPINGLPGGSTGVSATAYTNSFSRSLSAVDPTTQYTLGGTPLDFSDANGLDFSSGVSTANTLASGNGYAVLTVGDVTGLYRINLATGVASSLGTVATGAVSIAGLSSGPNHPLRR